MVNCTCFLSIYCLCMWMPSLLKTQIPAKGVAGWDHTVIRTPGRCRKAQVRVVKAIKLSKENLVPWIKKSDIQASAFAEFYVRSSLSDFPSRLSTLSETPGLSWARGPQLVGLASSLRRKLFVGRWKGTWRWQGVYRRKGEELC